MAKTQATTKDDEVNYMDLGIATEQEDDRVKIGDTPETLNPLRITHVRFDEKTKYFNKSTGEGSIVKINGLNDNGDEVKLLSMSEVLARNMRELIEAVNAVKIKDESETEWFFFNPKVRIYGFELVKTTKGKNPYVRIKTTN
jgi:hypothetical protein